MVSSKTSNLTFLIPFMSFILFREQNKADIKSFRWWDSNLCTPTFTADSPQVHIFPYADAVNHKVHLTENDSALRAMSFP